MICLCEQVMFALKSDFINIVVWVKKKSYFCSPCHQGYQRVSSLFSWQSPSLLLLPFFLPSGFLAFFKTNWQIICYKNVWPIKTVTSWFPYILVVYSSGPTMYYFVGNNRTMGQIWPTALEFDNMCLGFLSSQFCPFLKADFQFIIQLLVIIFNHNEKKDSVKGCIKS